MRNLHTIVLLVFVFASCNNTEKKPVERVQLTDTVSVAPTATSPKENVKKPGDLLFIERASGDLNKDGLADLITVEQDTIDSKKAYLLKIYFGRNDKEWDLVLTSDSAIVVPYPNGKDNPKNDAMFTGVKISKGTFTISHELTRGSFSHQFRYQNKKFELIGFRSTGVSGRDIEETDFNLSTGSKIVKHKPIGGDRYTDETKTIERIKYLPNLTVFSPYEFMY